MARTAAKPKAILVAESPAMRQVVETVEALADSDAPALIVGEPGTGRELIARLLHFASARRAGEFVAVRAEVAPEVLSYDPARCTSRTTLKAAAGGTLLIKDLCDLPRPSQRRLGRLLGRAPGKGADDDSSAEVYDVRVVGSCDYDLGRAVDADLFDRALYERLAARRVDVPALRDRGPDIAPLAVGFVRQYAKEMGRGRLSVSSRALERLTTYPWPGNVAELKGVARRLVLSARGGRIEAGDVDAVLPKVAERVPLEDMAFEDMVRSKLTAFFRRMEGYPLDGLYDRVIARVEKPLLDLVMEHTGGNQVRAAELLGVNRNTLRRKLTEHGIHARTKTRERPADAAAPPARRRAGTRKRS
jgi:two-component system, NtrC family, nitrogen regulation response regulator GlnG